jgi:hypothetical protein
LFTECLWLGGMWLQRVCGYGVSVVTESLWLGGLENVNGN